MRTDDDLRWLNADEQACWRAFVGVLLRLPATLEQQLKTDAGLTHFEYWVLALLSEAPKRQLKLGQLAAFANASVSRLSHVVTRLETRGLIEKTPCRDDPRATFANLTNDGMTVVVGAAPGHVTEVKTRVFDVLDADETAALKRICQKILSRL